MASKRVVKAIIDWAELAKRVPATQTSNLKAFKVKSDGFSRKVNIYPEEPPKIDWAYYKANAANKAIVEQLEKQYNSLNIAYPSDGGALAKVDEEEKIFNEQLKQFMSASNERIKQYEQEIETIKNSMPLTEATWEEFYFMYPKFALDPLNKPTNYPHSPHYQIDEEDLKFFRERRVFPPGPDKFFK